MQLTDGSNGVHCTELRPQETKRLGSGLAIKILQVLAKHPRGMHAFEIAKRLHEHEQKVYYHTRAMVKAGILIVQRTEDGKGGSAKILALKSPAYAVRFGPWEMIGNSVAHDPTELAFLRPFIENGKLNAIIVVGSPDPHGPEQARSRDVHFAIDLALFLGTYLQLKAQPSVLLDTELRDWDQNLIIIGGVVVNNAAQRINARSPAPYDLDGKRFVTDKMAFGQDNVGVIVKMPNPFAQGRWILHIAGRKHTGTRSAILAVTQHFDRVCKKAITIVEGIDSDSDGIIDSVRFLL